MTPSGMSTTNRMATKPQIPTRKRVRFFGSQSGT